MFGGGIDSAHNDLWRFVPDCSCPQTNCSCPNIACPNSLPVASFTIDTLSGCKPLIVHFTNTSTNATSYLWHFGDNTSGTNANPIHSYSHSGNYTVTLIAYDSTACGVFTDTSVQTFYFTVFIPPNQPTITQHGDTLTVTNFTSGIQWFDNTTAIPGATNQNYIVTSNGCYYVEETDTNGCKSKSDSICFTTGIYEIESNHGITIYPNPNDGMFTLQCQLSPYIRGQFLVKDVLGRTIYSYSICNSQGKETISIPLSNGIYFWEAKSIPIESGEIIGKGKLVIIDK